MKKLKYLLVIFSVFVFTSCACNQYQGKELNEMNLAQLNEYNKDLSEEKEELLKEYSKLLDLSGNKSKQELLELINYLNTELIKANVMITSESKSFFSGNVVSSGSGSIIDQDENYYYVLTNNHVIYSFGSRTRYYIYDYLNNEYQASLLFADPNYDMALLRFHKSNVTLKVINMATSDAHIGDNIITIGQPLGKRNIISLGEVLRYNIVNCNECNVFESNINYECVFYSADTDNGNSGGMIIDYEYNLVGVVTYGMRDSLGDYIYGAGSPVSKVKEFLTNNNFVIGDNYE